MINNHAPVVLALLAALCASCSPRAPAPQPPTAGVTVLATAAGLLPADVERRLALPLETKLAKIKGVSRVITRCEANGCTILLQYEPPVRADHIAYEAGAVINQLEARLPAGAKAVVRAYDSHRPPDLVIALVLDAEHVEPGHYAPVQEFGIGIMQLPSAVQHEVVGAPRRQLEITVDPERAASFGITVDKITQAIRKQILTVDEYTTVLVLPRARDELDKDPGRIPVAVVGSATVRLRDVAAVKLALRPGVIYRVDGAPAVLINVFLRSGASADAVAACFERILKLPRPPLVKRIVAISVRRD
ncbi:MAG: efflux RND transporter permease subunit [Planctomycetota bacterium]